MGISSPIIAAGATAQRTDVRHQPVQASAAAPGETYAVVGGNGIRTTITVSPSYLGQVYFQRIGDARPYQYAMYVVVDIGGTLTWVSVDLGTKKDASTGKPPDPMK